jgi:hypothetical protein
MDTIFNGCAPPGMSGGGGASGLDTADGGNAIGDNEVIRGDGTSGIQGSTVFISDTGTISNVEGISVQSAAATISHSDASGDAKSKTTVAGMSLSSDATIRIYNDVDIDSGTPDVTLARSTTSTLGLTGNLAVSGSATAAQVDVDNIRVDGNTISSTNSNGDINIDPAGAGNTNIVSGNLVLAGAVSGVTQLDVDNIRTDGNSISATNSNGSIGLVPNGTGGVGIGGTTSAFAGLNARPGSTTNLVVGKADGSLDGGAIWAETFICKNNGAFTSKALVDNSIGCILANDRQITWNSGSAAGGAGDAGVSRRGIAIISIDGSTRNDGLGKLHACRLVEANTAGSGAPNVLAANETRTLLTNEGATAENYHTLPSAVAGLEFVFYVQDADGMRVVANTGDTIRIGASVSATAGFVRNATIGSFLRLVAINATEWVPIGSAGTWTVDV